MEATGTPPDLWGSDSSDDWVRAADAYEATVARQGVEGLVELDGWVRRELPAILQSRREAFVTREELVRVTRWKMARGVWRGRNLALVQGNSPEAVREASREAIGSIPHPRTPITVLARLKGVGPATASAIAAASAPTVYPFFDELAAAQVPGLGKLAFTTAYYLKYAEALRERAARLGSDWSAALVERALWTHVGGKAGLGASG